MAVHHGIYGEVFYHPVRFGLETRVEGTRRDLGFDLTRVRAIPERLAQLLHENPSREAPEALPSRVHKLHGIEVFPGIGTPFSRTTRYGATFVAAEGGETPLTLIGCVNYTPIFFKPRTECNIVGGHWWLVARSGARYRGMLRGSFSGGKVRWNKDAKLAEVSVRLEVSGEAYRNSARSGELAAVLNHLPFPPSPPRIGGTLKLTRHEE